MLDISREFVRRWSAIYDKQYRGGSDEKEENIIREWLSHLPEPKYLTKDFFVRLGRWKTKRQTHRYQENDEALVKEATALAYNVSDEHLKLHVLTVLKGVGVPVASTILHFLEPDNFPIFDVRVRSSLKKAGVWSRDVDDASNEAWHDYVAI
ncbi:MAG: hypothetical protein ACE5IZ_04875, partial [Dehalococcoidia bacterium]